MMLWACSTDLSQVSKTLSEKLEGFELPDRVLTHTCGCTSLHKKKNGFDIITIPSEASDFDYLNHPGNGIDEKNVVADLTRNDADARARRIERNKSMTELRVVCDHGQEFKLKAEFDGAETVDYKPWFKYELEGGSRFSAWAHELNWYDRPDKNSQTKNYMLKQKFRRLTDSIAKNANVRHQADTIACCLTEGEFVLAAADLAMKTDDTNEMMKAMINMHKAKQFVDWGIELTQKPDADVGHHAKPGRLMKFLLVDTGSKRAARKLDKLFRANVRADDDEMNSECEFMF